MAIVPSDISSGLTKASTGLTDIFTQAQNVVQTVGSVYDQLTGKADGTQPATITAPAPAPVTTAPAPAPTSLNTQTKYVLIGLGVVVVLFLLGSRR